MCATLFTVLPRFSTRHDGPYLGGERFRAEHGVSDQHDLDGAFSDYMRFLKETDGFGVRA
jgi:hypothetical protein